MPHSRGPWKMRPETFLHGEYFEPCIVSSDDDPKRVADIRIGLESSAANARLIAAAPELLEACEFALMHLNSMVRKYPEGKKRPVVFAILQDAIAKASPTSSKFTVKSLELKGESHD